MTKKPKRQVHLYFDENDNMVEKADSEEETPKNQGKPDPHLDISLLKKKLKRV
jgi:hypothetical protein